MCTVSMIYDAAKQIPMQQWTQPAFYDFTQIVEMLKELDRKLGMKDCEDPAKAAWMRSVEERLRQLEPKAIGAGDG